MANEIDPRQKSLEQIALEKKIAERTSGELLPTKGILDIELTSGQIDWLHKHAGETVSLPVGTDADGFRHVIIPSADDSQPQS